MNGNFNTSTNRQTSTGEKTTAYTLENGEEIKLSGKIVRDYLVRGNGSVTDQEVMLFIALCKSQKLNPFVNDAYLIKYGDKNPATMVVGKGALDKRAELNPAYDGKECGVIVADASGQPQYRQGAVVLPDETLVGGWATVYRKGRSHPEHVEVGFDEYCGRKADGTPNAQWASKPATMIQKVAVAQALRQAFPNDLNGMYASEEMGDVSVDALPMPAVQPEPAQIGTAGTAIPTTNTVLPTSSFESSLSMAKAPAFTADDLL